MAALMPMAMYGLEVPAGDVAIPSKTDIPSAFRITMAAIDPSAEPEGEEGEPARATLKIIRQPLYDELEDSEDEDDFDADEMERILAEDDDSESDSEDEEEVNGGPSDPSKSKKARKEAAQKAIRALLGQQEDMEVDGVNGTKSAKAKGKMPASDEDSEDEDEDEEDSDEDDYDGAEIEEFVICTLDPTKNYQQPLDLTIGEDERVWFKVSGTHTIYLTGNYVEPIGTPAGLYDPDDEEDEEYDLEPDSDELESISGEEDELDDMDDPRIMEVDDEDEEEEAPKLIEAAAKKADKKGKNKRAADDSADVGLDAMISQSIKAQPATNGEQKLSKKQLKKMKKNDGSAVAVEDKAEVEAPSSGKSDKKVQFAKQLEQGPTPTKDGAAMTNGTSDAKPKGATLGVKVVQGVTIDDKKLGTGPAAKSGDRVGMRYIGKLQKDNKVFDSNKKGKPFTFKLGSGEVIKGWDIGIAGMAAGAERRITIPANLAYGSKGVGGIPSNSTLVFDVKVVDINKGK